MHQVAIAPDQVRDPFEKNVPGIGVGRDGCRTPMQWDATANAGFSTATPWLPLADDFSHENVVNLEADARSILSLYKALIRLRKQCRNWCPATTCRSRRTAICCSIGGEREGRAVMIALNLGAEPVSIASNADRPRRRNPAFDISGPATARGSRARWICAATKALIIGDADRSGRMSGVAGRLGVDVAALQQIIQPADAVPAIAIGFDHQRVLAAVVGLAVVFRQQVDQIACRRRRKGPTENEISRGFSSRLCTNSTELLRQS